MRNRTPDPTTSPCPSAGRPSDPPRFVLTEKGLRACGAASMEKAVAQLCQLVDDLSRTPPPEPSDKPGTLVPQLRSLAEELAKAARWLNQEMPDPEEIAVRPRVRQQRLPSGKLQILRYATVCGRFREAGKVRVPDLRLSGLWLRGAGFDLGQKYEVHVESGKLTMRAIDARPRRFR